MSRETDLSTPVLQYFLLRLIVLRAKLALAKPPCIAATDKAAHAGAPLPGSSISGLSVAEMTGTNGLEKGWRSQSQLGQPQ